MGYHPQSVNVRPDRFRPIKYSPAYHNPVTSLDLQMTIPNSERCPPTNSSNLRSADFAFVRRRLPQESDPADDQPLPFAYQIHLYLLMSAQRDEMEGYMTRYLLALVMPG